MMEIMDDIEINFVDIEDTPDDLPPKKRLVYNKIDALLRDNPQNIPDKANYLGVFGSRSLLGDAVLKIIEKHVDTLHASVIVTAAEPAGVCSLAQQYAREKHFPLQVHFLQMEKYARGAWERRSDHVIGVSDAILCIHDGVSKGTYNEILRCIHFGKPFIYERIARYKEQK